MIRRAMTPQAQLDHGWALALETSDRAGGVALARGARIVAAAALSADRRHAANLLPAIRDLCDAHDARPAEIALVSVSIGPGSFTGLRIGATVARTLALATGARLVAVPTMEVIAQNALEAADPPAQVAVLLDAGRSMAFAATFTRRADVYAPDDQPVMTDPAAFLSKCDAECGVMGEGATRFVDVVDAAGLMRLPPELDSPRVEAVHHLGYRRAAAGDLTDRHRLVPLYIRKPAAEEVWEKKQTKRSDSMGQSG